MRLQTILVCTLLVFTLDMAPAQSPNENPYRYTIDLTRVENDRIHVTLSPPAITTDEITFYLPKIVPGTYAIADYGRYVVDITAVDKKGKKLTIEKLNDNAWKIKDAKKLNKI